MSLSTDNSALLFLASRKLNLQGSCPLEIIISTQMCMHIPTQCAGLSSADGVSKWGKCLTKLICFQPLTVIQF